MKFLIPSSRYCNGFAGFGLMKWWGFFGGIFLGSLKRGSGCLWVWNGDVGWVLP
ncbi:hypothetical protein [Wielerella bovis]|uniref:hypothetical protein n=1 Tax=Wielerella bovis TaxID=2917790 RepID=UPI00201880D3|nr:hypothetical protein [Wielerella bovis]ULJ62222.1 hypothetical protein MIS46_09685 [Wielerella bovis]ULJ64457.1 hypothetical protein MIS33_10025 [Wielerella bovis]ULJ66735.1 hypothetical protein MIS31_10940 [Wielerella bovis]